MEPNGTNADTDIFNTAPLFLFPQTILQMIRSPQTKSSRQRSYILSHLLHTEHAVFPVVVRGAGLRSPPGGRWAREGVRIVARAKRCTSIPYGSAQHLPARAAEHVAVLRRVQDRHRGAVDRGGRYAPGQPRRAGPGAVRTAVPCQGTHAHAAAVSPVGGSSLGYNASETGRPSGRGV